MINGLIDMDTTPSGYCTTSAPIANYQSLPLPVPGSLPQEYTTNATTTLTARFVKPSPRPAPVKEMTPRRGKHISRDERTYVRNSGDETETAEYGDNYYEDHAAMDGRDSTSEEPDKGKEMDSPVAGASHKIASTAERFLLRESSKKRKRDTSLSKNPSSERSPKRVAREEIPPGSNKEHGQKNKLSHRREVIRHGKSSLTTVGPPKSKASSSRSRSGHHTPPSTRQTTNPEEASSVNPSTHGSGRNVSFENDTTRRGSTSSLQPPSAQRMPARRPLDGECLQKYLIEELRETELTKETIKFLVRHYKGRTQAKTKYLTEMLGYITFVKADNNEHPESQHRIQVDTRNYLLHTLETGFGHDFDAIESKRKLAPESLLKALWGEDCSTREHSLDLVLRAALKEMVGEVHNYDKERDPIFINGRNLELRLLQKIRLYYSKNCGKDIIRCLMPSNMEEERSELQELIDGSASKYYVRKILGSYGINATNFDSVVKQQITTPKDMRVWTDERTQRNVNVQIKLHIEAVLEDVRREWAEMSDVHRAATTKSYLFAAEYVKKTGAFIRSHNDFLSWVLKASELMAWMCFGVTTNHEEQGTVLMAQSYLMARSEVASDEPDKELVWNFPLASIFRLEEPTVNLEPICKIDSEYFKRFEEKRKLDF